MVFALQRGDRTRLVRESSRLLLLLLALLCFIFTVWALIGSKSRGWLREQRASTSGCATTLAAAVEDLSRYNLPLETEFSKMVLNRTQTTPPYFYVTFHSDWDGLVSPAMRANGGLFDAHIHRLFDLLLFRGKGVLERCRQGRELVLDVGMNFGAFALYAVNRGCHVIAFEMQPNVAVAVLLASHLNGFSERLQIVPHPVWSESNHTLMYYPRTDNMGGTHAIPLSPDAALDHAVQLRTVRIADCVPLQSTIRFMKLDVEGSEYETLLGMLGLLKRRKVLNLVMELQPEPLYSKAVQLLYSLGYQCVELQSLPIDKTHDARSLLPYFKSKPATEADYWRAFNFHGNDLWCIPWFMGKGIQRFFEASLKIRHRCSST